MTIDSGIPYATSPGGMSTSNGSYILGTIPAPGTGRGLRDVVSSWSACSGVASENPKLQRVWTATHLYWYSIPPSDNIYDRNNYGFFVEPYEKDYFYNDSEVLDMLARSEAFPSTPTYGFTTLKLRWYPANATMQKNLVDKPSYYSLVSGYKLDKRYIPQSFILASVIDKRITLKYYRENKLEPIPELKSLIWHIQSIDLKAGIPTPFFVSDIALGTLHVSESDIKEQRNNEV